MKDERIKVAKISAKYEAKADNLWHKGMSKHNTRAIRQAKLNYKVAEKLDKILDNPQPKTTNTTITTTINHNNNTRKNSNIFSNNRTRVSTRSKKY
jgi:hypothetical protein